MVRAPFPQQTVLDFLESYFLRSVTIVNTRFFRRHRSILPWRRCYSLMVCLSVTFVHCAQTAEDTDTISFAYDSPTSLPDRFKIWLTSVNPFLRKFVSK